MLSTRTRRGRWSKDLIQCQRRTLVERRGSSRRIQQRPDLFPEESITNDSSDWLACSCARELMNSWFDSSVDYHANVRCQFWLGKGLLGNIDERSVVVEIQRGTCEKGGVIIRKWISIADRQDRFVGGDIQTNRWRFGSHRMQQMNILNAVSRRSDREHR